METTRDARDDDAIFTRWTLMDKVPVHPRLMNKHILTSVRNLLVSSVEGRCTRHGYVRKGSVEILHVSDASIDMEAGTSAIFNVTYEADVCNPPVGNVIKCRVENLNQFGALAVNMSETRILEIILPLDLPAVFTKYQ